MPPVASTHFGVDSSRITRVASIKWMPQSTRWPLPYCSARRQALCPIVDLHVRLHDPSGLAFTDELGRLLEGRALAALEADLHDTRVLPGRFHHSATLADVVGQWLFLVDMEALAARRDEGQRVPVRWRGDDDRFEPRMIEQLAVILERLWLGALLLLNVRGERLQV